MPKWVFNHTAGALTAEEKQCIAHGMTKLYTSLQSDSIYAGGETPSALTTVSIYHIARGFETKEIQDMFFKTLDDILRPILKPKRIVGDWHYEANRDFWRMNGIIPPPTGSELENKWFAANQVTDEEEPNHTLGYTRSDDIKFLIS
ncbi:putative oxalocrotonate tautomerase [Aspergillus navahoensis]